MIFCSTSGSTEPESVGAAVGSGAGGGGGGAAGLGGATGSRIREIGGRNDLVLVSPSARLGRGFFSSINDTVSMIFFRALGASGRAGSAGVFAATAGGLRAGSEGLAGAAVGAFALAGASTFVLFVSL